MKVVHPRRPSSVDLFFASDPVQQLLLIRVPRQADPTGPRGPLDPGAPFPSFKVDAIDTDFLLEGMDLLVRRKPVLLLFSLIVTPDILRPVALQHAHRHPDDEHRP